MTTFVAAKCPSCGGELQVPQDRNSVRCMYCSGEVVVRQAVAAAHGNPGNWMKLGLAAAEAGNYQEAITNFNKVLEVDPHHWQAWLEKADSTGWLSNLSDCRIGEMVAHTRRALSCAPKDALPELKLLAAVAINDVATAYNDLACKHLRQFITVDVAWPEFLEQTMAAFSGLEFAHEVDPTNKVVLRNMVVILTDLIQGVAYQDTDAYGRPIRRVHRIKNDYALRMTQVKQDCETKLKQLDPSYQAKEVKKAKVGAGWIILSILRLFGATRF